MLSIGIRSAQTQPAPPDRTNRPSLITPDASNLVTIYTPTPPSPSLITTSTVAAMNLHCRQRPQDRGRCQDPAPVAGRILPPPPPGISPPCATKIPSARCNQRHRCGRLGNRSGRHLVCGTIIDVVRRRFCARGARSTPAATQRREGDFHGGGAVEPEAAMQQTQL
jgi:hypothetical protein